MAAAEQEKGTEKGEGETAPARMGEIIHHSPDQVLRVFHAAELGFSLRSEQSALLAA